MPIATFDGPNLRIILTPPVGESVTTVLVGVELYSDWKEWMLLSDNSKYPPAMRSTGGDELGGGQKMGSYFFVQNQYGWKIKPEHEDAALHVLELVGNLFPEDPNTAMFEWTAGTNVVVTMTRSALTTVLVTGGSALTADEHTRLFALPQATLQTDERAQLMAIPLESSGMSQAEHDQLMALPLSTLETDERTKLLALPDTTLETDERAKLLALPDTTLETDERAKLLALPDTTLETDERAALLAVDGDVAAIAAQLTALDGAVATVDNSVDDVKAITRNRRELDPTTGIETVYEDDGITVRFTRNVYEDVAGAQPYRGQGAERVDRLE